MFWQDGVQLSGIGKSKCPMLNSAAGEMAERKTCLMAATETSFLRREARLIIAFVVVAVALLLVFRLGSEIREGETAHFDEWLLLSLRQPSDLDKAVGPGWVRQAMVDITALGGVTALTLLTAAVIGYLVAARRYATATLVAARACRAGELAMAGKDGGASARPVNVGRRAADDAGRLAHRVPRDHSGRQDGVGQSRNDRRVQQGRSPNARDGAMHNQSWC